MCVCVGGGGGSLLKIDKTCLWYRRVYRASYFKEKMLNFHLVMFSLSYCVLVMSCTALKSS